MRNVNERIDFKIRHKLTEIRNGKSRERIGKVKNMKLWVNVFIHLEALEIGRVMNMKCE